MTTTPRIRKDAVLIQALVGFLIAKIVSDLYKAVAKKVKYLAVKYLSNQFVLGYIASHDADPKLRGLAASKLISPLLLRRLLKKEKDDGVRLVVLRHLRTSDVLKEYRRPQLKRKTKLQLVPLVKTQDGLYDLLRGEEDKVLTAALLKEVTSPRVVARLRSLPQPLVQEWVKEKEKQWERRKDEGTNLAPILEEETPSPELLRQVQSPKAWYLIAKKHKNMAVRMDAVSRLEGEAPLLSKLEGDTKFPQALRMRAAFLLGGTKTAVDIALTDPDPKMRVLAVAHLDPKKNLGTLTSILKSERKSDVLTQAILVTTSKEDLEALKSRINPEVSPHLLKILEERLNVLATPAN
jgi:hypothetical protein